MHGVVGKIEFACLACLPGGPPPHCLDLNLWKTKKTGCLVIQTQTQRKKEMLSAWMESWHVFGNIVADELAGTVAEMNVIPSFEADRTIKIYTDLAHIQNIVRFVTKMFPHRTYNKIILDNDRHRPNTKMNSVRN